MEVSNQMYKRTDIDVLRGISITGIVLYHISPAVFPGGFLGVVFFFVLSGYLLSDRILTQLNNHSFSIANYCKRRIRKIYPPLFTIVVVVCSYLTLTDIEKLNGIFTEILSIFSGLNNWWQISNDTSYFSRFADVSPFTHMWFLSVTMQFYIFMPPILILYNRFQKNRAGGSLRFVFLLFALLSALLMSYLYDPGNGPERVYYGTDTMAFSLFIGMFVAAAGKNAASAPCILTRRKHFFLISAGFAVITFLLFLTVNGQSAYLYRGGMFIISLCFAFVLYVFENNEKAFKNTLPIQLLSFMGRKSYIIYLWHYPIITFVFNYLKGR